MTVLIEIPDEGLKRPVERIKETLLERQIRSTHVNPDAVIAFDGRSIFPIVAIGDHQVRTPITVQVGDIERRMPEERRSLESHLHGELPRSAIEKNEERLGLLGHQHTDVRAAILIEIQNLGGNGTRTIPQHVFGVFSASQILMPREAPHHIAEGADDQVLPAIAIEVFENRLGHPREVGQDRRRGAQ